MSPLLLICIVEFLLLLILVAGVLLLKWKEKRRRHTDIELLLDAIKDSQGGRNNLISRRLVESLWIDQEQAQQVSQCLIEREKRFLKQFVEQQLQQGSVVGFYEQLCELLDEYLLQCVKKAEVVDTNRGRDTEKILVESLEDDTVEAIKTEALPEWGDVFD